MLGFTLSKLNLLILVMAIFTISSFFLFGLSETIVKKVAADLTTNHARSIYTMVNSETFCDSKVFYLPDSLDTSPSGRGGGYYYVFSVKALEYDKSGRQFYKVAFVVSDRKEEGKVIAASSFDVPIAGENEEEGKVEEIVFFDYVELENSVQGQGSPVQHEGHGKGITLDPQDQRRIDAYVFLKETHGANKTLYFVPCSSTGRTCLDFLMEAGEAAHPGEGFKCTPLRAVE